MDADTRVPATCASCGSTAVQAGSTRSAFWHDDRLVVVEDIPAIVCSACGEHSYEDYTVVVLDLLRGGGFPAEKARGELRAPVFSFLDAVAAKGET
jgi:YgiT-type zinc finger domain-containing protein